MVKLLVQWLLSAFALLVVSNLVNGFQVEGFGSALTAAFPISILTLGLFLLVINGIMILLASSIVRGFHVRGFGAAFWGAVVLALLGMIIRALTKQV